MWEPRRLSTLWTFTACFRDSFTFFTFYLAWSAWHLSWSINCTKTKLTADTMKLRGNATVRRLACSVAWHLSFLVFCKLRCLSYYASCCVIQEIYRNGTVNTTNYWNRSELDTTVSTFVYLHKCTIVDTVISNFLCWLSHFSSIALPFPQFALLHSVPRVQLTLITILGSCRCQFSWCTLALTLVTAYNYDSLT
jgi:hypothetical protein